MKRFILLFVFCVLPSFTFAQEGQRVFLSKAFSQATLNGKKFPPPNFSNGRGFLIRSTGIGLPQNPNCLSQTTIEIYWLETFAKPQLKRATYVSMSGCVESGNKTGKKVRALWKVENYKTLNISVTKSEELMSAAKKLENASGACQDMPAYVVEVGENRNWRAKTYHNCAIDNTIVGKEVFGLFGN